MYSLQVLIMVAVIVFCIGALLGALISRTLFPPAQKKLLEESLKSSRNELEKYQRDVAKHFADTASLVHKLTESYRDVHNHLANGALQLTNSEITRKLLAAGDRKMEGEPEESLLEDTHLEAPKDWAPKTPGGKGTLSEEFGLNDEHVYDTENDSHRGTSR